MAVLKVASHSEHDDGALLAAGPAQKAAPLHAYSIIIKLSDPAILCMHTACASIAKRYACTE
jgi:hypothetical protein